MYIMAGRFKVLCVGVLVVSLMISCGGKTPEAISEIQSSIDAAPIISINIVGSPLLTEKPMYSEVIPLNNCGAPGKAVQLVERTRIIRQSVQTGANVEVSANGAVKVLGTGVELGAAVASHFGFSYGTENELKRSLTWETKEDARAEYTILHKELWQTGTAEISVDGRKTEIDFGYPVDYRLELAEVKPLICPTPTDDSDDTGSQASQTLVPQPTSTNTEEDADPTPTSTPTSEAASGQGGKTMPTTPNPTRTATPPPNLPLPDTRSVTLAESDHPYANNEKASWVISNDTGSDAMRLSFSRLELEDGVDKLDIFDQDDRLIQSIQQSAPDGMWSGIVPGAIAKLRLTTDSSVQAWGFAVDKIEAAEYLTIGYSAHPYSNDSSDVWVFNNVTIDQSGTKLVFDRLHLEEGVDFVVLQDAGGVPYQWITGDHEDGFETKAVPGPVVRLQLLSDASVQNWGFNVEAILGAAPNEADPKPMRPQVLAESNHPYEPTLDKVWTITNPDTAAVSSKVHFSRLDLAHFDWVEVLDANDTVIQTLTGSMSDFWSDYVPGRVVKIRLVARPSYEDWGFRVDAIANAVENPGLAQSNHPYEPELDKTWTIVNPNPSAVSSRVHFNRLDLANFDRVEVMDANDNVVQTFGQNTHATDFWSDHVPGRVVKIRLVAIPSYEDWGFRVDTIE